MTLRSTLIFSIVVFGLLFSYKKHKALKNDQQHQHIILSSYDFKDEPEQVETTVERFDFKGYQIKPLANFLIRARILSRENYRFDKGAELASIDLALGWKRMADPAVYETLGISQRSRWYHYYWKQQPPIPQDEIKDTSANMHLISADKAVENVLDQAKAGQFIKLKGLLVEASKDNGWKWRSSLSRSDSGDGACELVFVEAVEVE